MNGFHCLKQVKIGKNSFTLVDFSDFNNDQDKAINDARKICRSFHILNCELLESIENYQNWNQVIYSQKG